MSALYNEIEPYAAAWLRNLIAAGLIAPGVVDERSIVDLRAEDVAGPGQRHFFAGIGVWSYALRLAGVPDDLDVWTGSCPCQPFSAAGRKGGFADERHLWPTWFKLIEQRRPSIVFGEQVASPDGLKWLDAVFSDLEGAGYAVGAADLCAAGVGAPHIRQRLFFVGVAEEQRRRLRERLALSDVGARPRFGGSSRMGDAGRDGIEQHARELSRDEKEHEVGASHGDHAPVDSGAVSGVANDDDDGLQGCKPRGTAAQAARRGGAACGASDTVDKLDQDVRSIGHDATRGFWSNAERIFCRDNKWRPVEPGAFPLVDGTAFGLGCGGPFEGKSRVGMLKGFGNAIVAQQAAVFIRAALTALSETVL